LGRGRKIAIDAGFGANDQSVIFASAGRVARMVAVNWVAVSPKLSANPDYRNGDKWRKMEKECLRWQDFRAARLRADWEWCSLKLCS
jgi:hypothetical protein